MEEKGKVVLITGAGGGLGRATALRFAREESGHKFVLVDLNEKTISETMEELGEFTDEIHFVAANVTKSEDVKRYVDEAVEKFGRIDVFFNNAGIDAAVTPTSDYDEDEFDKVMNVNTKGAFLGMKYVLQVMKKQGSGSIVNTASVHGIRGMIDRSAYVASKHAVVGLTRTAAGEVAQYNVRVNAVCPAPIVSALTKEVAIKLNPDNPEQHFDIMKAKIPAKRLGTPEDIANIVRFLGSDEAEFINGAIIPVDGAMTAVN
ncbi:glucose 1-dehydrogenase [Mammaliicoccus sciuri]|uniref:NAD(P)-dependent dehydrogenase, short-chain alcohol dehydrogenase family n=1 Tax=Sporosarcina newyorkensis TaxID=759851 RepID=A0A1T4XYX3_9BACL|nr:glucose 1-dehydrogenase [Sporosarcina newyorkensis]SKA94754.1 NAD(P)-dependent dehydrogenase, short-chain alcohol dehydrogenase family [Sporosarcina newyorkensis]